MTHKIDLTIGIISHRPNHLKLCLASLNRQSLPAQKILVVKNKHFSIPQLRNLALKKCTTKYLAFIDDDCLADSEWIKNAYLSIIKSKSTFVIGRTLPISKLNYYSQKQFLDYQQWFQSNIKNHLTATQEESVFAIRACIS